MPSSTSSRKPWEPFVFKRDPENGMVIGPDDCHYGTEAEALYYGLTGFCGCGAPEETHAFLIDCLASFDRGKLGWGNDTGVYRIEHLIRKHPETAAYVVAYLLAKIDLTEHGGSVGGSWLSALGKQFIAVGPMKETDND